MSDHVVTTPTQVNPPKDPAYGTEFRPGDLIASYRVIRKIGRGGCGTVYLAETEAGARRVAIKVLHPALAGSPRQVTRFVQEARAVQQIRHPNIVDIYESGYLDDSRPYLVMDWIEGESLAVTLKKRGRLSPREALALMKPICAALHGVHQAKIVHRDIKASNVMLAGDPEDADVKLLDFGVAKLLDAEEGDSVKTSIGRMVGTPNSMAPEQILGQSVDARTDVYALGALLFRVLTGRHAFPSHDAQIIVHMHLQAPPPRPSELAPIPMALDEVVQRAMAKDPAHRYADTQAFLHALEQAIEAAANTAESSATALAIYVDGRIRGENREIDDFLFIDLMDMLDIAGQFFRENGFQIILETSQAVLGAMAMSDDDGLRDRVIAMARRLESELAQRPEPDDRLHINLCVHQDQALVGSRGDSSGRDWQIVGGAIVDVGSWAPTDDIDGLCMTWELGPTWR